MTAEPLTLDQVAEYDAIVIGAGISGMFMLYRLRELGMNVRVFEAGTDVGGTWYWNRYPGARFDSESWTYGYSFSKELLQEWDWKEHFSPQPDTLEYLNLRRRQIRPAPRHPVPQHASLPRIGTTTERMDRDAGKRPAGALALPVHRGRHPVGPHIAGHPGPRQLPRSRPITRRAGRKRPVDFTGKRVGVIGTGATAIQAIPEIAKQVGT